MARAQDFLRRDDCLLFLVDIQKVLLDLCVRKDEIVKNCGALIDICNTLNVPIIFTSHNAEKLGPFLPELTGKVTNPTIINKLEFSCFENEAIKNAVEQTGRRTLLLAGMESHICIFHTGAHALRLGYRVDLATDVVTSRVEENRLVGIKRLEQAGAIISSTEMIIFELLNRAGTEEFRKALPIIKKL